MSRRRMRFLGAGVAASLLATGVGVASVKKAADSQLRVVIQLSDPNLQVVEVGIRNAMAVVREAKAGDGLKDLKVVVLGPALKFFQRNASTTLSPDTRKVFEALESEKSVQFYACQNTLSASGIQLADLMPGFKAVPSGAFEILRLQEMGYRYFRP